MSLTKKIVCLLLLATVVNCGSGATSGEPCNSKAQGSLTLSGTAGTIETIAGSGNNATDQVDADADGAVDCPIEALTANLDTPMDATIGPDGRLYIVDWNGHKIRVLGGDGMVAFVAGTGVEGDACENSNDDGTCPATSAELNHMTDVTFDADENLIVAAWHNAKIKRIDFSANVMGDLCGTGNRQFAGDGGPCESEGTDLVAFDLPSSVAYDAAGNLFISDQANQIIRRLDTNGIVTTVVGNCPGETGEFGCSEAQGYEGDGGPALNAKLNNRLGQGTDPQGKIAFDSEGNLTIADTRNHCIRKVIPGSDGIIGDGDSDEEIITTVAGMGDSGSSGDGGAATEAQLNTPTDVEIADDGTLYIADTGNNCIRKVDSSGIISTVAGQCGEEGAFSGDGGLATEAELNSPYGIELDANGNLLIADSLNYRIRVVYLSN